LLGVIGGLVPDPSVYVFAIDQSTGAISPVAGSPFATQFGPSDLAVSSNGNFVYTFSLPTGSQTSGTTEGFSLDTSTGTLTEMSNSPFSGLPAFDLCQFSRDGVHGVCATDMGHSYIRYAITVDSSGNLTPVASISVLTNYAWAIAP
jgi:hypothetical protein